MSADIQLLDQNTANQIAAGEVVEKPASVVKELVENSLDAGATNIEVAIYEGGTEFIRVRDNGSGMTEANAKLAVLRHATSKIRSAQDLLSLHTLGFRGEALPSIASVSKFSLVTRPINEEFATSITISGDSKPEIGSAGGSVGTTVTVKDLFFNVPARRKFLRTINTEGRYINDIISKLALSRPDVHFTLLNNDKEVINTPGNGELTDVIAALYGKNVAKETLPVAYKDEVVEVEGYIGKPTLLKGNRQWQTVFVNGRTINNRMVSKAIDHAYQSQIPKAGFPFAVLNIKLDPNTIDINVHPQKSEIKFGDEGAVYGAVFHALGDALTKPLQGEEVHHEQANSSQGYTGPEQHNNGVIGGHVGPVPHYEPHQEPIWRASEMPAQPLTDILAAQRVTNPQETEEICITDPTAGVATIWPLGQVGKTFIIAQSETALYLIDQHAAHERIMYDRFIRRQEKVPVQEFLVPIFVEVAKDQISLVEENRATFLELGVDVEPAGETMVRVSALPTDVDNNSAEAFIHDILKYLEEGKNITPRDLREEILHYAACHSAIRAGEVLTIRQMRQVIMELLNTEHPFTCPHGRPCMVEVTMDELFKMFKRS
jgi:DNA mismatch repair protein MutL